LESGVLP